MSEPANSTAAPADRRPHAPWPVWRRILAYAVFFALAIGSIWLINRRVDDLADGAGASQSKLSIQPSPDAQ